MNDLVNELEKQINIDKEVITVLPRNGIKAIKNLNEKIEEMSEKYQELNKKTKKEIEERYKTIIAVEENEKIGEMSLKIEQINNEIDSINDRSSYEKMELDKHSYNINGYYKKNIETINEEIIQVLKTFEKVGIKVTAEDFNISEFTKEYMTVLIKNAYNGEINSAEVKECFEKVYWKCSELMSHIYVNLRYIYDKNENEIDKFYKNTMIDMQEKSGNIEEELEKRKQKLIKQKKKLEGMDDKIILGNFLSQKYNITDYMGDNYKKSYEELLGKEISKLTDYEKNEMDDNIEKLYNNLVEYSEFLEFKFIYDEVLEIRAEEKKKQEQNSKEKKNKTDYEIIKDEIKKEISNIAKLNEKISKPNKSFFNRKSIDEQQRSEIVLERNEMILSVKNKYLKMDEEKIYSEFSKKIYDTSTYLDVLKIASYYYNFLAKTIIKKEPEITDQEITKKIEKFKNLIKNMEFSVISNVMITENKTLAIVIKDRYKLFGIILTKESLEEENLDDILKKTKLIYTYNNIKKSNLSFENINFVVQVNLKQKK